MEARTRNHDPAAEIHQRLADAQSIEQAATRGPDDVIDAVRADFRDEGEA